MKKTAKYLSFGSLAAIILAMMAATILERLHGTEFAFRWVYHNPLFIALWGVTAICGMFWLVSQGAFKRFFTFLLHVALVVILAGALVTHLAGTSGEISLRTGESSDRLVLDDGTERTLPFSLQLDEFAVEYYEGSRMPSDYRSEITVLPAGEKHTISMNNILKYGGYRFYQADYDEDLEGSILAVSHDPWGIAITYTGYLLLLISMIGFFFQKDSGFRKVLRKVAKPAMVLILALLIPVTSNAQTTSGLETFYYGIANPRIPFMVCLTLGIVMFVLMGLWMAKERKPSVKLVRVLTVVAAVLFAYLTVAFVLRWIVAGQGPFAGTYNVMMLMAWLASLAMLLMNGRFPLVFPLGFLLAGFTMLLASMRGPAISPLMPVLRSPLLSFHVMSMMMSYTLFGLAALNGVMGLILPSRKVKENLRDISLLILYPAVFLITFGTFLGAVWANISWGTYWGWDPKETWALITLLVYSFALHGGSIKAFRNPVFFHIYTIAAFLSVLVTYFGVNMLLGGMHSYM